MLKFPGGGHEFGEGLKETLEREFKEELSLEIEVGDLFYVNDFPQISAFNKNHQLISFYFLVNCSKTNVINSKSKKDLPFEGEHQFWIKLSDLSEEIMTFPIDKIVARKLN